MATSHSDYAQAFSATATLVTELRVGFLRFSSYCRSGMGCWNTFVPEAVRGPPGRPKGFPLPTFCPSQTPVERA